MEGRQRAFEGALHQNGTTVTLNAKITTASKWKEIEPFKGGKKCGEHNYSAPEMKPVVLLLQQLTFFSGRLLQ